jgi:hypothetical protein
VPGTSPPAAGSTIVALLSWLTLMGRPFKASVLGDRGGDVAKSSVISGAVFAPVRSKALRTQSVSSEFGRSWQAPHDARAAVGGENVG